MPTDFTFTGQRKENKSYVGNLMDYGARMYAPGIGRFISADSIVPGAGNPQSLNRYSYVNNRPLNMVDPSGHAVCNTHEDCEAEGTSPTGKSKPAWGGINGNWTYGVQMPLLPPKEIATACYQSVCIAVTLDSLVKIGRSDRYFTININFGTPPIAGIQIEQQFYFDLLERVKPSLVNSIEKIDSLEYNGSKEGSLGVQLKFAKSQNSVDQENSWSFISGVGYYKEHIAVYAGLQFEVKSPGIGDGANSNVVMAGAGRIWVWREEDTRKNNRNDRPMLRPPSTKDISTPLLVTPLTK